MKSMLFDVLRHDNKTVERASNYTLILNNNFNALYERISEVHVYMYFSLAAKNQKMVNLFVF